MGDSREESGKKNSITSTEIRECSKGIRRIGIEAECGLSASVDKALLSYRAAGREGNEL